MEHEMQVKSPWLEDSVWSSAASDMVVVDGQVVGETQARHRIFQSFAYAD